jgi:uncharacterized protein (TIGR03066 family)
MKCLRLALAAGLVVALFGLAVARADNRVHYIPGIWRMVKCNGKDVPAGTSMILQFTADGKVVVSVYEQGKSDSRSGVWKLKCSDEGSKLTIQMLGEPAETETIKTFDDTKLVTVDAQGQETVLRKSK